MHPLRSVLRRAAVLLLLAAMPVAAYAGYLLATGNVHTVADGILYRSGQLDAGELEDLIARHNIRSIVNLRGEHPNARWYQAEASVAEGFGLHHISIPISARSQPALATMIEIAHAMRDAPRPILVHCEGGADRSGLASAIYRLAVLREPATSAAAELSVFYGHFPWLGSRTGAMDAAFSAFSSYWSSRNDDAIAMREPGAVSD